jgi:16S rRNA processing protein RimM
MPVWQLEKATHAGDVLKLHGYLGSVRVAFLFSGLSKKIKPGTYIYIEWMEKPVPYLVSQVQWTADDSAILTLVDVTEAEAKKLVGRKILLPEDLLPKKKPKPELGDVLFGYSVVDESGTSLGEVMEFYDTGVQKLLEVKHAGGQFLMPYHPDFVIKEDKRKKQLIVRLPEGMVDLEKSEEA